MEKSMNLLNLLDLLNTELGSSDETRVTSTLDGNEVIGVEDERVSDISEVADQETTIPAIKTEPNLQMATALDAFCKPSVIASKVRSLNDFPDEILLQILKYVGPEDVLLIIAEVCKRWSDLTKDVALWKKLSYQCVRSSDLSRVAQVLTNAPALHSLIICDRNDVANILEFLNHINGDLRKLILKFCLLGENSTGLLTNIVAMYPDLEGLSLEHCLPLTSAGYCLIPQLKKLSELNISYCKGLSGETVRLIADSCQHLKKLSLLGVRQVYDDDVIHVINKLGKQLTTLALDGCHLTDVAFTYLNNCTRVQQLEISYCMNMTDRGLLEGIGSLQELTSLHLTFGRSLTVHALSTFLHQSSMTSIVSLNLSSCTGLDDEGLKGIAERCIHLKELDISDCCNVTDAGISTVISHCSQLRVLNLEGLHYITGEGYLALLPSNLPHLRELCLNACSNVCDKYVEDLAALPDLNITRDWVTSWNQ